MASIHTLTSSSLGAPQLIEHSHWGIFLELAKLLVERNVLFLAEALNLWCEFSLIWSTLVKIGCNAIFVSLKQCT